MKYILSTLSLIVFANTAWSSNDGQIMPYEEWKREARDVFKLEDNLLTEVGKTVITDADWAKFKQDNFVVASTLRPPIDVLPHLDAQKRVQLWFISNVKAQLGQLLALEQDCQADCERLREIVGERFADPVTHPSKLGLADYKTQVTNLVASLNVPGLEVDDIKQIYALPYSRYEDNWRKQIADTIIKARVTTLTTETTIAPAVQVAKLKLFQQQFTNVSAALFLQLYLVEGDGRAGPYLAECRAMTDTYMDRMRAFRNFCQFFYRVENELVVWSHCANNPIPQVIDQNMLMFLNAVWVISPQGAIGSFSPFLESLKTMFWASQEALVYELYYRGVSLEDIQELAGVLQGERQSFSSINTLAIASEYYRREGLCNGVYDYPHPDLMREALTRCVRVYFPAKIREEFSQFVDCFGLRDTVPFTDVGGMPRTRENLMPVSVTALRAVFNQLANLLKAIEEANPAMTRITDAYEDRKLQVDSWTRNKELVHNIIYVAHMLGDVLLRAYDENDPSYVDRIDADDAALWYDIVDIGMKHSLRLATMASQYRKN
jgi:hypothetical protein